MYLPFVILNWVCRVRGNFSCGPGLLCSVCVSAVWSAGPVHFLFRHFVGADGGTVQVFPFLWLCCSGYGTVEIARGVVCFSSDFLQFAVSSLGGWMFVVGFCFL
jgi:hypothetical protein